MLPPQTQKSKPLNPERHTARVCDCVAARCAHIETFSREPDAPRRLGRGERVEAPNTLKASEPYMQEMTDLKAAKGRLGSCFGCVRLLLTSWCQTRGLAAHKCGVGGLQSMIQGTQARRHR